MLHLFRMFGRKDVDHVSPAGCKIFETLSADHLLKAISNSIRHDAAKNSAMGFFHELQKVRTEIFQRELWLKRTKHTKVKFGIC